MNDASCGCIGFSFLRILGIMAPHREPGIIFKNSRIII
jgi:hypothetical protein